MVALNGDDGRLYCSVQRWLGGREVLVGVEEGKKEEKKMEGLGSGS